MARDSIADGFLQEVQANAGSVGGAASFQEIANGGAWDDFICFAFRCNHCGQRFALTAETYHGSGGAWRPEVANAL